MKQIPSRALIVVGAALALGIGGGIAVADIPSSTDGTITACMVKPGGTIRLINAEGGATCKKGETKVEWNAEGQPGADGVSGYEVVRDEGTTSSSSPFIGFSHGVACPAGKKMLGWFASGFIIPGPNSSGGVLDAAYGDLFVTSAGLDQVSVEFTRGNGGNFVAGDVAHWRIEVTCAAVTP